MESISESQLKLVTLARAESAKSIAEFSEIRKQMNSSSPSLPSFSGYEKARMEGQLAFFEVMGVKCRPINPAESVKNKGKVFIHSREEALDIQQQIFSAYRKRHLA